MPKYIDPTYDAGFKLTFGRENQSEELLIGIDKEEVECESLIDMWIYNIKNMGARQEVAFMRNNEIFKRLEKVTSVASLTPAERRSYEADVKNARDTLNQIRTAEERGEKKTQIRIARNMLAEGLTVESISAMTGLSINEIERL
ncbi:MAG: hypothetical protein HDR47_01960 [Bacteroides sp.]|nr:hypothetical protein [Bacteroides sp.]